MTSSKHSFQNSDSISNDFFEALLRDMRNQRDWREEVLRRYWEIIRYSWEKGGADGVRSSIDLCRQLTSPRLRSFTQQARAAIKNKRTQQKKRTAASFSRIRRIAKAEKIY